MASTLTKILLHITFSTKGRASMIPEALEPELLRKYDRTWEEAYVWD